MIESFFDFAFSLAAFVAFVCSFAPASKGSFAEAAYYVTLSVSLSPQVRCKCKGQ